MNLTLLALDIKEPILPKESADSVELIHEHTGRDRLLRLPWAGQRAAWQ
jgi:hypothetical protein